MSITYFSCKFSHICFATILLEITEGRGLEKVRSFPKITFLQGDGHTLLWEHIFQTKNGLILCPRFLLRNL